jgi:glycosyltransferase involved in cell wall biosynthesis
MSRKRKYIFIENVMYPLYLKFIKKLGLPIIIDVRDDYNLHAEAMGIETSKKLKLQRELTNIENFEIAEKIFVPSNSFRKYYLNKYKFLAEDKVISIPNASDIDHFNITPMPDNSVVGIVGGMNYGQGFELLLNAVQLCKDEIPELKVKCAYSYSSQTKEYRNYIQNKYNETWIEYREDVSYLSNATEFLSSLFVFVIPRIKNKYLELASPSKLFDAMASGRPVVVTNLKEQAKILRDEKCGLICDFTPKDMAEKILFLLRNPDKAKEMGKRGRIAAEERHNWDVRVKEILNAFRN